MQASLVNLLFLLIFSLFLTISVDCAAQRATINVVVNSRQPIPVGQQIFVEGNFKENNSFYEDKIALIPSADGSYIYSFIFKQGAVVDFTFTRGMIDSHEVDINKQPVPKRRLSAESAFQTQTFTIEKWNDLTSKPYQATIVEKSAEIVDLPEPDRLRVHKQLKGIGLSARDVYVWLPPNYHIDNYKRYPVIYIHQNHAVFNPNSTDSNNDWRIDETTDDLSSMQNKAYILVSIDNRNDRSFAVDDWSVINPYCDFINQKVKPLIDANYRTLTQANEQICIGSRMGGSVSFALAAKFPYKFGKAICISPVAYFPEDYKHLATFINKYSSNKSNFIIEAGVNAKEARYQTGAKSLHDNLLNAGFNSNWQLETDGDYSPIIWENRIKDLLNLLP